MCYLVGERPSGRHPKRHWNDLLNYVHNVFAAAALAPLAPPAPAVAPAPPAPAAAGAAAGAAGAALAAAPAAAAAHFRWTVFTVARFLGEKRPLNDLSTSAFQSE